MSVRVPRSFDRGTGMVWRAEPPDRKGAGRCPAPMVNTSKAVLHGWRWTGTPEKATIFVQVEQKRVHCHFHCHFVIF